MEDIIKRDTPVLAICVYQKQQIYMKYRFMLTVLRLLEYMTIILGFIGIVFWSLCGMRFLKKGEIKNGTDNQKL